MRYVCVFEKRKGGMNYSNRTDIRENDKQKGTCAMIGKGILAR